MRVTAEDIKWQKFYDNTPNNVPFKDRDGHAYKFVESLSGGRFKRKLADQVINPNKIPFPKNIPSFTAERAKRDIKFVEFKTQENKLDQTEVTNALIEYFVNKGE